MVLHDIIWKHSEAESFGSLFPGFLHGLSIFPILWASNHWLEGKIFCTFHPFLNIGKFQANCNLNKAHFKTLSFKTTRISALSTQVSSLCQKQRGWATEKPSILRGEHHQYVDVPPVPGSSPDSAACMQDPQTTKKSAELGSVGTMSLIRFHGFILGEW